MNALNKIQSVFNKILYCISVLGGIWIVFLMFLITADVLGREILGISIQGTAEIVANSIVGIAFSQFGYCLMVGKHVRTTVIYDKVSQNKKEILDLFAYILGAVIFAVLIVPAFNEVVKAVQTMATEGDGVVKIVVWPVKTIIFSGYVSLFIGYILLSIEKVLHLFKKDEITKIDGGEE